MANVTLTSKERDHLLHLIEEKYGLKINKTGTRDKYDDLCKAINETIPKGNGEVTVNQLSPLFNEKGLTFRDWFVDACYYYATGLVRKEYQKCHLEKFQEWEKAADKEQQPIVIEQQQAAEIAFEQEKKVSESPQLGSQENTDDKVSVPVFTTNRWFYVSLLLLGFLLAYWSYNRFFIKKEPIVWYLTASWDNKSRISENLQKYFVDEINEKAEGRWKVVLLPNNQLPSDVRGATSSAVYKALKDDQIQMFNTSGYYLTENPDSLTAASIFYSSIPFGMKEELVVDWVGMSKGDLEFSEENKANWTKGYKFWRKMHEKDRIIPFPCGLTGEQWGGWYRRQPKSIEDYNTMKIRVGGGFTGVVMKQLGAENTRIPQHDILSAMAADTLDWVEWINATEDYSIGMHYMVDKYPFIDESSWHEPFGMLALYVNQVRFDALDDDLKVIFFDALGLLNKNSQKGVKDENIAVKELLKKNPKITFFNLKENKKLSDDLRMITKTAVEDFVKKYHTNDGLIDSVYHAYKELCINCEIFN